MHKRDLLEELDVSRSTIDRAIDELSSDHLVRRTDDGFVATEAGRLALDRYDEYVEESASIHEASDLLANLSPRSEISVQPLVEANIHRAEDPAPYRPLEHLHDAIDSATRYRALLPALDDPRHLRLLYEHVIVEEHPATLIVSSALQRTLRSEFPRRLDAMADRD
ncbi:MAG: hypothetical protein ABEI52_03520, partial [Halobacteriaceae archaeon]